MDAPLEQQELEQQELELQRLLRYDGEERRRRALAEYMGDERRVIDPPTEQDHPEVFGPN